jgi:hypothetical protein
VTRTGTPCRSQESTEPCSRTSALVPAEPGVDQFTGSGHHFQGQSRGVTVFSPLLESSGTTALDHKLALKMGVTMLITTLPVASASSVLPKTAARLPVPRAVGLPLA